jgi:DNA excision repair protein ERCC-2
MSDPVSRIHEFHATVRELVEFVHRSGDLAGESSFRSSNRAVEGTRGHRRIQESRGEDYRAEVPVERIYERSDVRFVLTGRVDGIFEKASPPIVEEIKTVMGSWSGNPDAVHIAQLRAYAALLAEANNWDRVDHRLIYLNLETDEQTVIQETETRDSLSGFLDETLHEWFSWLSPRAEWLNLRDASLEALPFPFTSYRAGQRGLARQVYRSIRDGQHLFIEAPTGLGKTMATLYPAVRALPRMADGQVFFVTAKTPGRLSAAEALSNLRSSGVRLRSLMLTAKRKICFTESPTGCDERTCPFAVGYYDRIKPAVRELLQKEELNRTAVEETARAHQVCPFELSLDASLWTDVIVGDFNHVFDPSARLQRHFADGPARHAVLVDEAHNLVDRSREMYSATLSLADLAASGGGRAKGATRAKRALAAAAETLETALKDLRPEDSLQEPKPYHDGAVAFEKPPRELLAAIRQAARSLEEFLAAQPPGRDVSGWLEPWFAISAFLKAADAYDEHCRCIFLPAEGSVKIFCADPSSRLRESLKGLRSVVFFSATLSPLSYFRDLLGGTSETSAFSFDSPFQAEQMQLSILGHDVTFKGRAASIERVAADLAEHVRQSPGNHLIFCPSMQYLSEIEPLLEERIPGIELFSQTSLMDENERTMFLERFASGSQVVGLAVLGGIFSEGVDLPGDRLVGVAVVGVGLPRLSLERDILQALFEETRGEGFDYAYRYPGMQRVSQAVGRLIRSEQDRGSALLIDRRFRESRYRALFPAWWLRSTAPQ